MPKYSVDFIETYSARRSYEVEADTEEEARDIAEELQSNSAPTPIEDIQFDEWLFDEIYLITKQT